MLNSNITIGIIFLLFWAGIALVVPDKTERLHNSAQLEEVNYVEPIQEEPVQQWCIKHTADERQNQYVEIAARISNNDLNFLELLDAENGLWEPLRRSKTKSNNGYYDYGFCQINAGYHYDLVADERFADPEWQLQQCWELYVNGETFYGDPEPQKKNFTCPAI